MGVIYSVSLASGAEQTEIALIIPDTRPSALLSAVQNRSRRFCVRRVEELLAFADKVEAQVNAAQTRVNNLTQSILAKAFRGELTLDYKLHPCSFPCGPTFGRSNMFQTHLWRAANPELISGENSAQALLERIKAEREALALAAKAAKKKPKAKKAKA